MWGFAIDVDTSSPIYIKECISRTGHLILLTVFQDPYGIRLYPTMFIDEIKMVDNGDEKKYLIQKTEVLNIKESDVLAYNGLINTEEIRRLLSPIMVDQDVDEVIKLTTKITS